MNETNGVWGKITEVAVGRTVAMESQINAMSCVPPGYCTAGGFYAGGTGLQAFVVSKP